MWLEESKGKRINHARTEQFLEVDGDTVAAGCPFCLQMFKEGVEAKGVQDTKKVRDLVEMVAESLGEHEEKENPTPEGLKPPILP